MSYYALFKGWLLLSQPPGCPNTPTSFSTQHRLQSLSCGSGLFPSRRRNSSPAVRLPRLLRAGIRSLSGVGNLAAPSPTSALPPALNTRRSPKSDFGENKLSPSSFGISPLPTPHPMVFQHQQVRASIPHYRNFTLDMGRSPGFGSTTTY